MHVFNLRFGPGASRKNSVEIYRLKQRPCSFGREFSLDVTVLRTPLCAEM